MELKQINEKLDTVTREIWKETLELNKLRFRYLEAQANYELVLNKAILTNKTDKGTAQDIKAKAIELTEVQRFELVRSESSYRSVESIIKALRDRLEALKELGYNARKEMELVKGGVYESKGQDTE